MKKYYDLTWQKSTPLVYENDYRTENEWNQTLMTKINQARAQMNVALKNETITKKKIIISENCRKFIKTLDYFYVVEWDEILFSSEIKNIILVYYDENYSEIYFI